MLLQRMFNSFIFILPIFILCVLQCDSVLTIECTTTQPCHNDIITCPQNEDCIIHCNGAASCAFSTILCPNNESKTCSLSCNANLSCTHATIKAHNSSSLSITSNGYESLSFSNIYCPDGTCNLTYNGYQNGYSMMSIYTTHNYNAIHLTCASILVCWSIQANPTLYFGDGYSNTCSILNTDQCQSTSTDHVLIAQHNPHNDLITTTDIPPQRSSTDINNHTDHIPSTELDQKPHTLFMQYTWGVTLMLVFIGMLAGFIVSICCAFVYIFFQSRGLSLLRMGTNNPVNDQLHVDIPSPKRTISKRSLSPSLRDLSPALRPTNMELVAVDFLEFEEMNDINRMISASYENTEMNEARDNEGDGDVIVTVERYANSENKCDESGVNSPMSSTWMSFKDPGHVRGDTAMSMTLSVCMEKQTNGIAPDEFVVSGTDDTPRVTPE